VQSKLGASLGTGDWGLMEIRENTQSPILEAIALFRKCDRCQNTQLLLLGWATRAPVAKGAYVAIGVNLT
jgi:hypothetical protein